MRRGATAMHEASNQAPNLRLVGWPTLVLTAVLCAGAVAAASLRHTGSLAFPIDDGYIYSNYVLSASQGHFFTYNPGQLSGGITSLGWYFLCTITYILLAPLHALLGGLAPPLLRGDSALANQAAHLYLAAYVPGVACLAATALGVRRLAHLALPQREEAPVWRAVFCWLLGAVSAADLGLVWGAMSGLEVPLASAVAVWTVATLLEESEAGNLRWSLALVALVPFARPDLLAVAAAGVLWLALRSLLVYRGAAERRDGVRRLLLYCAALLAGVGATCLIYFAGWGRPLPSSFYAKVGGLRLGARFFSAAEELLIAGRGLPFIAGATALVGGILAVAAPLARKSERKLGSMEAMAALLPLMASMAYVAAVMATLPWFGQEDRYLLPAHPFIIVQIGILLWFFLRHLPVDQMLRSGVVRVGMFVVIALFTSVNYLWATQVYAVEVRNIADAHIAPALWLARETPPASLVAAEPIGAARLFSNRPTIDLVGLTTPATLGTYRNWPVAWRALNEAGARYLLFYPAWFEQEGPPPWAKERARFEIPDNRIAGDSVISVYELDWRVYPGPQP